MNLVEEKYKGLILTDFKRWPLQLIKHIPNISNVAPSPTGPTGGVLCSFPLLGPKFRLRVPNKCSYSKVCNLLRTLCAKSQIPVKETYIFRCFGRNIRDMVTPIHVLCDSYAKIFRGLNIYSKVCWCSV